jgi:hypothetical protein
MACGPEWEEPLSTIQNTRAALASGSVFITSSTSAAKRGDAGGRGGAAEHPGGVGVVGGQIGQGAATAVLELRPPQALGCRRQVGMAPGERLELGLLIGAEHVLVLAQRLVVPDAVI